MDVAEFCQQSRVLIVAGKGGVGKTTVCAALALMAADAGLSVLVVEQNANVSLSIADRGYVLSTGRLVLEGKASELIVHDELRKAYLGR